MYAHFPGFFFWGITFKQYQQYHILFHPCRQVPLKKGDSQMESSVQYNPAAPSPSLLPGGRILGRRTQKRLCKNTCGLGNQRPRKWPNSKFHNCSLIFFSIALFFGWTLDWPRSPGGTWQQSSSFESCRVHLY